MILSFLSSLSSLDHIIPYRYRFRLLFFLIDDRVTRILLASLKAELTETLKILSLSSDIVKSYPYPTQSDRLCITTL